MQREQPRRLVGVVDLALEALGDHLVQRLASAEGQAAVRRLANDRPAEAMVPVTVALEELGQPFPGAIVRRRRVGLQHVLQEPWVEAEPQDGGAAHERAVGDREPIDARRRRRFHGVGQHRAGGQRRDEVEQELRVPARTVHDDLQVVRQQRRVDRGRLRQHDRGGLGERPDLEPEHTLTLGRPEPGVGRGATRDREQPRALASPFREMVEQFSRRLVHVVGVLDLHQRMHGKQPLEQRRHDLVQLRASVRLGERLHLRGAGRHLRVERQHDQRQPGQQVGSSLLQLAGDVVDHESDRGPPSRSPSSSRSSSRHTA